MIRKFIAGLSTLAILLLIGSTSVQAASVDVFSDVCESAKATLKNNPGGKKTPAPCEDKNLGGKNPIYGPGSILTKLVNIITILVGLAAVISIIVAGFKFITSGNNPQEVKNSRELVTYALIGVVLAAVAQLAVRFVLLKTGV